MIESQEQLIDRLKRLLYQPVPFLPETSFLNRGRISARRQKAKQRLTTAVNVDSAQRLEGTLEHGRHTQLSLGGFDLHISESTWILGELAVGTRVQVRGSRQGLQFEARKIVAL